MSPNHYRLKKGVKEQLNELLSGSFAVYNNDYGNSWETVASVIFDWVKEKKADVVITNPTHFAVALRYDTKESTAPVVVAKGADYVAQKIKEIAKDNQIEIVENKPLARMIYHNVDVGAEIPPELYQAVAEVLAYVYRLKNPQE